MGVNSPEPHHEPERLPAADPATMRASDADRDRVADRLREALAEGRLSAEEHAERIDAVYAAKTYAELAPILHDLPMDDESLPGADTPPSGSGASAPARESGTVVAVFGGADRKGRWLVPVHTNVVTIFGGVELDFRQAVLTRREVTVNITCVFGGVDITVPPGVRVVNEGSAVFGGISISADDTVAPDAPVIRLTGFTLFGGVDVKRKHGESK